MDAFLTSTISVALAEIGDKTQLLALLLATRFPQSRWQIVLGILLATLANHAASAWLGQWLGSLLQGAWGQTFIGLSFAALGAWLLIPDDDPEANNMGQYGAFTVTLILFFLAEIGDKTQVATIALGAQYQSVIAVTTGTTLGMLLANVPVVIWGERMTKAIPMATAHRLAAALFITLGIFVVAQAWLF